MQQGVRRASSDIPEAVLSDADDLEGYLSPAEDAFSVFSDEQCKQKPYAQVSPFLAPPRRRLSCLKSGLGRFRARNLCGCGP